MLPGEPVDLHRTTLLDPAMVGRLLADTIMGPMLLSELKAVAAAVKALTTRQCVNATYASGFTVEPWEAL